MEFAMCTAAPIRAGPTVSGQECPIADRRFRQETVAKLRASRAAGFRARRRAKPSITSRISATASRPASAESIRCGSRFRLAAKSA